MTLINTHLFREDALYFQKHGRYDDGVENTNYHYEWWRERIRRCRDGYTIGGKYISGYHYFYLNFWRIRLVRDGSMEINKNKKRSGSRVTDFPSFWDVDYLFFTTCEIAENGLMNIKDFDKNIFDTYRSNLRLKPDQLDGGRDVIWLKPRGVGASFKGSSMGGRNYTCYPDSLSIFMAYDKQYLNNDGVFTKFSAGMQFINKHCAGLAKVAEVKNSKGDMHIRASYKNEYKEEAEDSFMSEVMGVSLKDDPDKARGKRGKLFSYEEIGKFPDFKTAWGVNNDSVREGEISWGMQVGWGTGGTEGANYESVSQMIYEPDIYNLICFDNIWDEGMLGTSVALFTPAYMSISNVDSEGNSLKGETKKFLLNEREKKARSADPTALLQRKAEKPFCPSEATLNTSTNIFKPDILQVWFNRIITDIHLKHVGIPGILRRDKDGLLKLSPSQKLRPVLEYPIKKSEDNTGCIIQYFAPYRDEEGNIPNNLYLIGLDPYAQNAAEQSQSVGAAYVFKNINNFSKPDDVIVASYIGRPESTDEFNRIVFELAEYYNAKIAFENDAGDTLQYANRYRKTQMLATEFEFEYNSNIPKSGSRRGYGVSMNSGRENRRKIIGDSYIKDWLFTERKVDENGKIVYNYNLLYDIGLIQELIKYNDKGNFDRVSALRVLVYFMKEIEYRRITPKYRNDKKSSLGKLFAGDIFR